MIRRARAQVLRFPFTTAAVVFAVALMVAAVTMDINVVRLNLGLFDRIERSEVDQVMTAWLLVVVAFGIDQVRASRVRTRESYPRAEQIRVVHVRMRTVQDIVGNCLTELQLMHMEAEGVVPAEALSVFDRSIRVTTAKLAAIAELRAFAEEQMAVGPGLHIEPDTHLRCRLTR